MNKIYALKFMQGEMGADGKPDYTGCTWEHCDDEYCWGPDEEFFEDEKQDFLEAAQIAGEPIKFRSEMWLEAPFGAPGTAPTVFLFQGETVDDGASFDTAEDCLEYLASEVLEYGNQIVTSVSKYGLAHVCNENEYLPTK